MKRKGITLIGMPASGKSTIGKELSAKLGLPLLDVDQWMEEHEGMPLRDIIRTKGAEYTLNLETSCIRDQDLHETIVSTPGSIIYNDVLDALEEQTHIIWLNAPLSLLQERLAPDVNNERGIIGLEEKGLDGLFAERMPLYEKWAQYTIDCGGKEQAAIVAEAIAAAEY